MQFNLPRPRLKCTPTKGLVVFLLDRSAIGRSFIIKVVDLIIGFLIII